MIPALPTALPDAALDQLFRDARSFSYWTGAPVSDETIKAVYDLARMGPTASNSCPARFVFLKSDEAKQRLKPHLLANNVDKVMSSAFTVIVAYDLEFYEKIPQLFPHNPGAREWYNWSEEHAERSAFRSGTLQGAYLILAARALGLDCGPMSGFSNEGVDEAFFAGTSWRSNFICAMGQGDASKLHDRSPRLSFDEACQLL
jgi:3-hydroxypropanoate dehydrogenase